MLRAFASPGTIPVRFANEKNASDFVLERRRALAAVISYSITERHISSPIGAVALPVTS